MKYLAPFTLGLVLFVASVAGDEVDSAAAVEFAAAIESAATIESAADIESAAAIESAATIESAVAIESEVTVESAEAVESAAAVESAEAAKSGVAFMSVDEADFGEDTRQDSQDDGRDNIDTFNPEIVELVGNNPDDSTVACTTYHEQCTLCAAQSGCAYCEKTETCISVNSIPENNCTSDWITDTAECPSGMVWWVILLIVLACVCLCPLFTFLFFIFVIKKICCPNDVEADD